ncbi:hypothetical protein G5V58_21580 [Nocardioides anomalus]|uniref:Uncharacterized protein n=1 Tax=Nocardioides anomalus TaxID=2712223 RepID=A0A6G6WIU5_9ACTN|nr:DUF5691 domain-containing protein [Nocardioides anomalus]QIG45015.1 hypothetical protein G5V58_21580 [Nocardioides anomalus]
MSERVEGVGSWWEEVSAAALIGTARRPVPALPAALGAGRPDAPREVALLDAAALGSALRRAGVRPGEPEAVDPAAPDDRPAAPARAVQLLELLVRQSPVGPHLAPELVRRWLEAADVAGARLPHHLLPELLDLASGRTDLRPGTRRVADQRGAWLAAANPVWAWLPEEEQPVADGGDVRALLAETWDRATAGGRAELLDRLRPVVAPEDEPLLERALDDRSARVRELAAGLLDALPGSARAARMAARLRPLITSGGLLRRTVDVELPGDPDPAGVRDGLVRPKRVGSVRGWWLQRLAAGAPLDVWGEPSAWRRLASQDAKVGIAEAVLARRDTTWAAALVEDVWHPDLVALVPPEQRDAVAASQLARATSPQQVVVVVNAVPAPWGPVFSRAVLQRLGSDRQPALLLGQLGTRLATGLDPLARPALEAWARTLDDPGARDRVSRVIQYLTLVTEIPEAFR